MTARQAFAGYQADIARAYDRAAYGTLITDPVREAWAALADECGSIARACRDRYDVSETDDPEPYPDADTMVADIRLGRFIVSRAYSAHHPLWTIDQNVAFRIAHDIAGHYRCAWFVGGPVAGFDWLGELDACHEHARYLSRAARMALFTECIAQTGNAIHHGEFPAQYATFSHLHLPPDVFALWQAWQYS